MSYFQSHPDRRAAGAPAVEGPDLIVVEPTGGGVGLTVGHDADVTPLAARLGS